MGKTAIAVLIGAVLCGTAQAVSRQDGEPMTWGGRTAHPAVVNPVLGQEDVLSLRGEWEFSVPERDLPNRNGVWGNFNQQQTWKSMRPIRVPGCWEAQGVGERGPGEPWDPIWDHCGKPVRHKYMGEGWYRKTVTVPAAWRGKRIWLKVGGVRSVGWIWVNDRQVALVDNYCATEKYEITDLVEPGKPAKIVVDVDNRKPSRKGLMSSVHRWGGIYRDIELEATPDVFIDDAWVRGDFDKRLAEAHVEVAGKREEGRVKSVRVTVEGETVEQAIEHSNNQTVLKVPLRNFRPWSPEHPNLYTAKVELVSAEGGVLQTRFERFGVRKLEVRGRDFYLNGHPFYVRGFGDDAVYPLTGVTPADRDFHRRNLAKARAAGFNAVRLHTHCEAPEYFEAADELGILIQAELPYYSDVPCEGFAFDPVRDVTELWRNFRRHPSFAVYSTGNEGSFGDALDTRLHDYVKRMDPDRLKICQDSNRPEINAPDRADFCGGPIKPWARGTFDPGRPFVTHEYLNLCVKSDSRDEAKYTGAWLPPATRDARKAWLARSGLGLNWGDLLQDAQNALQKVWQKRGIESARLDPFCRGYCFWTVADVVVWNESAEACSAQGLFNPFWEDKRKGSTAADFARFNSASCVLVDLCPTQNVFVVGDRFRADVFLAHYGEAPLADAQAVWRLAVGAETLATGRRQVGTLAPGPVRRVAAFDIGVPPVDRPVKASLAVSVGGIENSWDVWLFPKGPSLRDIRAKAAAAGIVIAPADSSEARAARTAGRPLVTVDGTDGEPNVALGWWWMGAQVGTAIRPHRALGDFPHEGVLTPLLFRIVRQGRELPVSDMSPDDMIIVGEGGGKCYLYLGERQVGASRAFECHGLDLLSDLPEGNWLLDALVTELARKRPCRLVAFGDSITESVIGIDPRENWLRLLQSELGEDVRTFNAGVGGNSAREAMRRFDRDVLLRRPDILLVEFGGNNHDPRTASRRVSDDEFLGHLQVIHDRIPPGTKVVAVTFPPVKDDWHVYGRDPFFGNGLDEAMQSQREILRRFARRNGWPIVDLYELMKDRRESYLLKDGVHLNPSGQKLFARAVRETLDGLLAADGANMDFSRGLDGWSHRDRRWRAENGVGRNGSVAAVWEGTDGRTDEQLKRTFPVEAGVVYRVGVWAKTVDLLLDRNPSKPILCCAYSDPNGKYLGSFWANEVVDNLSKTDGWRYYEGTTPPLPSGAANLNVTLTFRDGTEGKVIFDDLSIEQLASEPIAYLMSSRYRDEGSDGKVDFHALLQLNLVRHPLGTLRPVFRYRDAKGDVKETAPAVLEPGEASLSLDVTDLAIGRQDVRLVVRTADGGTLAEASCPFTRLAEPPRSHVRLDGFGRTWVDGRKFFPLGFYSPGDSQPSRWAPYYAQLTNGVINCLLPYREVSLKTIREFDAAGVKTVYSLREWLWGTRCCKRDFRSHDASLAKIREIVRELRNEPGIIAWYVMDEAPLSQAPFLNELKGILHEVDPDRPLYAVTDKPYDIRQFAAGFDVMGMDPYPIGNHGGARIDIASKWPLQAAAEAWNARPMWQVPQTFNWWWERKTEVNPEHRFPRRDELANMCYQAIAAGANGLISFDMAGTTRKDKDGTTGFARTVEIYREIGSHVDLFLSDPGPSVKSAPAGAIVRTWRREDGSVSALVVNTTRDALSGKMVCGGLPERTVELPPLGYGILNITGENPRGEEK